MTDNIVQWFSLSPTPPASITSLVETLCESPNKSDENQRKLCNSPRNNINSSQYMKRDSPTPTTESLIEDVKKLEIHTSDPDLSRRFKTNSPLASSSNLSKPESAVENLRLCPNNNENNSRKSELKWHCMVCVITCDLLIAGCLVIGTVNFFLLL
jgi:hypothetical protein